ncbi:hypothetical protein GGR32_001488 [Mesonia hippocampi]|uniref:Acyl-CoA reductase n=1 Tax=Mesonia hippocampi TaxID=1628250 RepID=A0A840EIM9_9FLAO|nr:acyl-CoA reductase [Mesonia hippocampi]MBB4119192.1 hypothetical protein [Mesonia hippocampi]
MNTENRIAAFAELGDLFRNYNNSENLNNALHQKYLHLLQEAAKQSIHYNGWFTPENITFAIQQWGGLLTKENLSDWLSNYALPHTTPKNIGIVMAGNIPLVGFHDFLSVLISGHNVVIKLSSNDKLLLPVIAHFLTELSSEFSNAIVFEKEQLKNFDAVIATGSNNTARYFEYYFGKFPSIIRKNRNSVAVLTGKETQEELSALAEDIFRYYGLGCRNVAKLFVPKNYNFDSFFKAIFNWQDIINQHKYANNYDYNKAVYLMSEIKLLDNGFLMLKEDTSYSSPIACLFYEFYEDEAQLLAELENSKQVQCIVSKNHIPFGQSQQPQLHDYADGIDSIEFLRNL